MDPLHPHGLRPLQCIQKWLASTSEQRCPMCRREWTFKGEAAGTEGVVAEGEAAMEGNEEGGEESADEGDREAANQASDCCLRSVNSHLFET